MRIHPLVHAGRELRILDQTRLPERERYLRCRTASEVAEAIRVLAVRGAPLIGIAAAYALALDARSLFELTEAARRLVAARPTAVNLSWAVRRVLRAVARSTSKDLRATVLREARAIHREDAAMCEAIGRHGAKLGFRRILTICNTGALATGGIGTAFGVCLRSRAVVFACETRPLRQGARLTMWEAEKAGLKAFLIADGAAAAAMSRQGIEAVVAGADRIAANGDTANKIGTYGLAIAAKEHRIPFYIAAPSSTIDPEARSGRDIPIEERAPAEISERFPAWNPAFDVTPARLITGIITERGVFSPSRVASALP